MNLSIFNKIFFKIMVVSIYKDVALKSNNYMALMQENLSKGFANNKGADQHAQSDQYLCYLLIGKYNI